jgi:uncharacterized membrane protein HdeD (DUF308 family)
MWFFDILFNGSKSTTWRNMVITGTIMVLIGVFNICLAPVDSLLSIYLGWALMDMGIILMLCSIAFAFDE